MARKILPNFIKRSGASFETLENFSKNAHVSDSRSDRLNSAGVPLAQIGNDIYLTSKDELHCFLIGDSGCGKTRRVIMPSIHFLAKANESMVISDPKGELYRTTASMLKRKGYEVLVLNFRNPERGNRWNPLSYIEELYNSGNESGKDAANMLLNEIADTFSQTVAADDDPYWAISACSYFRGIASLILRFGDFGDLTLENVARVGRELGACYSRDAKTHSPAQELLAELPVDSPILNNLSPVITNAENTRNCILSMFESMLSLYSSQSTLMDLFSKSEINISSIGQRPTALFFILPDDSQALYPIATVFVKQIYSALVRLADSSIGGRLPTRVTFLLDEFANFAKLPSVESMLTAARSRGIRFVLVCQSMDQLSQKYSPEGMEILLANCRCWIYMSCRNLPFLERLQSLCGNYISPYTGENIPLITIDRLQQFERGQILVLNDRCKPFIGYLSKDYSMIDFGNDYPSDEESFPPENAPCKRCLLTLKGLYDKRNEPKTPRSFEVDYTQDKSTSALWKIKPVLDAAYNGNFNSAIDFAVSLMNGQPENSELVMRLKCCVASFILFGKATPRYFNSSISFKIDNLLAPALNQNDPQALALAFLYEVERGNYQNATYYIMQIQSNQWVSNFREWYSHYWEKLHIPEMALLSAIATYNSSSVFPINDIEDVMDTIYKSFSDFVKTDYFKRLVF